MKDVSAAWLSGVPWRLVTLILVAWCMASFAFAAFLGRLIRRADERAGIVPEKPVSPRQLMDRPLERVPEKTTSGVVRKEDADIDGRRAPSRSGPFAIEAPYDRGARPKHRRVH